MSAVDVQQQAPQKKKRRPKRNEAQIPSWWLELTPHDNLDVEDEKTRRLFEERMALWYAEQAEEDAAKGLMFDIDGNPLTEEETSVVSSQARSKWAGRQDKSGQGGEDGNDGPLSIMFGGRNFKPGSEGWDPRQWDIDADDPDFDQYKTGAKLPQQYVDAMSNYAKATGKYKAPDYGKGLRSTKAMYGEMGAKAEFKPDWAKKQLRSTGGGAAIYKGIYNDSPNKHLKYRANAHRFKESQAKEDENKDFLHDPRGEEPTNQEYKEEQPPAREEQVEEHENMIDPADVPTAKSFSHKDYYYNATTPDAGTMTPKINNGRYSTGRRQPEEPPVQQPNSAHLPDPDEEMEVVEYEDEEVVGEEETVYEEEVVEEEIVEEVTVGEDGGQEPAGQSLEDLQATLAAKMAELKRLQGGG